MQVDTSASFYAASSGTSHGGNYTNAGNVLYALCPESRDVLVTVTYNGVSGTLIGSIGTAPRAYAYRWINPPIGTYTMTFTYASSQPARIGRAVSFIGADTASPNGTVTTYSGTAINKTLNYTTTKNNVYLVDCLADPNQALIPQSGQTNITDGVNATNRVASYRLIASFGPTSNTWNGAISFNGAYAGLAFEVFPRSFSRGTVFQSGVFGGAI